MKYPAYPNYKDSPIPWLPKVPANWEVHRLKWAVTSCDNGVWGEEPDGGPDDVACIRVADFDRLGFSVSADNLTMRSIDARQRASRQVRKGDLLIEKSGGGEKQLVGCVVQFEHDFPAVCSNFVARMGVAEGQNSRYWTYAHAALYAGRLNDPAIKQTTGIQNLDAGEYLNNLFAYAPAEDQKKIADFLDWRTAQIDALIAKKQAMINRLREQRAALIDKAITYGVRGNQDSRATPDHWQRMRLRFLAPVIEQGWSPQCENAPAENDAWGVTKVGCVNGDQFDPSENKALPDDVPPVPELELQPGDVLISRANTKELVGSAAVVPADVRPKLLLCDKLFRLRLVPGVLPQYLTYVLRSSVARWHYEQRATGASSSMQNIGQETLKELPILLPPLDDQREICAYIASRTRRIDTVISSAISAMDRLTEYRSALITAAVTGQIDVRGVPVPAAA